MTKIPVSVFKKYLNPINSREFNLTYSTHSAHIKYLTKSRLYDAGYMSHVKSCSLSSSLCSIILSGRVDCWRFLYQTEAIYNISWIIRDGLLQCSTFLHSRTFKIALFSECNIFGAYMRVCTYHIFLAISVFTSSLWAAYMH